MIASLLVLVIAFSVTSVSGVSLYRTTKDGLLKQGELNALQYAKQFDSYLLVRKNAVLLAASVVDNMMQNGRSTDEIIDYLVAESQDIQRSIDPEITGLYGWINGKYCDGAYWTPDEDYVATERPWYVETVVDDSEVTFVRPYLDEQTKTVMMTMGRLLRDGESVVALDISLGRIQEITEEIAQQTPDSCGVVLDKNGTVIAHSDDTELGKSYFEETGTLGALLAEKILRQGQRQLELEHDGNQYIVYVEDIEGGWHGISLVNTTVFFRPLKLILVSTLLLTLLEMLIFVTVLYKVSAKNLAISVQNLQIGAVADMFVSIYDLDLSVDTISVIRRKQREAKGADARQTGVQAVLNTLVDEGVDTMSKPIMLPFVDISTLCRRLETTQVVTEEFLNSERKWCRARLVVAERDRDGRTVRALLMVESIDEEKRRRDNLKTLSETDQMTGLNNRAAGEKKIRTLVNGGTGGMFVMLDIDKFKKINDRFGHDVGDKVIIGLADGMTKAFRNTDILMRLGGDEFVAYAPGVLTEEAGRCIIERLFKILVNTEIKELGDYRVFVSVGAAFCQHDELLSFIELYKRADACAYESKKTPGNILTFYRA